MEAVQPETGIVSRVLTSVGEIDAVAAAWRALEADCTDPLSWRPAKTLAVLMRS